MPKEVRTNIFAPQGEIATSKRQYISRVKKNSSPKQQAKQVEQGMRFLPSDIAEGFKKYVHFGLKTGRYCNKG